MRLTSRSVQFGSIISSIATYLVLPLALAAISRAWVRHKPHLTNAAQLKMGLPLKTGVLVIVIVAMFASQADVIFDNPRVVLTLIVPITTFFAIAFGIAIGIGRAMHMPYEQIALLAFLGSTNQRPWQHHRG